MNKRDSQCVLSRAALIGYLSAILIYSPCHGGPQQNEVKGLSSSITKQDDAQIHPGNKMYLLRSLVVL